MDQKHINNLPQAQQFNLTAVKLQMFGAKTRHAKQIGTMHPQRREKKILFDVEHVKQNYTYGFNR